MSFDLGSLFRRREVPLSSALPYWEIRSGVVFLATGQAEVGLEVRLPATALWPEGEVLALYNSVLPLLRFAVPEGERLRLHVEVGPLRRHLLEAYEGGLTSNHPAARMLAKAKASHLEAARWRGDLCEVRAYLSCSVLQPGRSRPRRAVQPEQSLSPGELAAWERKALTVRQRLFELASQAGLAPAPLFDQGLFELLWRYFNPGARLSQVPVYFPAHLHFPRSIVAEDPRRAPPTLATRLGGCEPGRYWDHLKLGRVLASAVSLGTLPSGHTQVGMASRLLNLPAPYWLIVDYRHEPQGLATRALEARARRFRAAETDSGSVSDYVDAGVRAGASETGEAALHIARTGSHLFQLGVSVLLCHQDKEALRRSVEAASGALAQLPGVTPVEETAGLFEQFLALAPFSGRLNERMHLVLEENAADFVPLSGPWPGSTRPVTLLRNRFGGLTSLDPFDERAPNYNGIVIGGSGSGKTFFMQTLIAELLKQECEVMIVDRGFGYEPLVRLFGGALIPFDTSGQVSINPFDLPAGAQGPSDDKKAFLLALAKVMAPGAGGANEAAENAIVMAAITQTYARAQTDRTVKGKRERRMSTVTLSDLVKVLVTLEEVGERPASTSEKELARNLALRLQQWTGDTPLGRLVDRGTTVETGAPLTYFETSGLGTHQELQSVATLLIADTIWTRVKEDPKFPKLIVFDEFWSLLKVPAAASFVVELYRRFRRYHAGVYAVTQSLKDLDQPAAQGILQNTSFHFLFPVPGEEKLIAELLNLGDNAVAQLNGLAANERYRELLAWIRHEGHLEGDVLRVAPRALEYWAFTSHPLDAAERDEMVRRHGGKLTKALLALAERRGEGPYQALGTAPGAGRPQGEEG